VRVLEIISPGGLEQFFAELAPLLAVEGGPDFAAVEAVQARYRVAMDFQTIEPLMKQHGLVA
jgi:hypothetical protein